MSKEAVRQSLACIRYCNHFCALMLCVSGASAIAQSPERHFNCDGQWHTVPATDLSNQYGDFNSLNAVAALSPTNAWAVGQWQRFAGKDYSQTLIEHWDGASWTPVQLPQPRLPISFLSGVSALSSNDVWAVGYEENLRSGYRALIEHWDGNAWTIVQDGTLKGWLTSVVAIAPDDVWAVGSTDYIGYGLIEHWDGSSWTADLVFSPVFFRAVTAINKHNVWAVGQLSHDGFGDDTYAVHFDGVSWSVVPTPSPLQKHPTDQNWLTSISTLAFNDIWAVGVTRNPDYGIRDRTLTEHWDGKTWTVVSSPRQGTNVDNDLWSVVALDPNNVWAVGALGIDSTGPPLIQHWSGTVWKPVAPAASKGILLGLARVGSDTELWATGYRTKQNLYTGTLVQHLCTDQ